MNQYGIAIVEKVENGYIVYTRADIETKQVFDKIDDAMDLVRKIVL